MEPFVAIDFETANGNRGSACAVGLVRFSADGSAANLFSTLLHPHPSVEYFAPRNIEIHGIHPEDVANAPTWADVYPQVLDFAGSLPIVAHNMSFDGSVLNALSALYSLPQIPNPRICTVKLSRKLLSEILPSRSLDKVFRYYFPEDSFNHHEATADALACGRIFARMQSEYGYADLMQMCPPACSMEELR